MPTNEQFNWALRTQGVTEDSKYDKAFKKYTDIAQGAVQGTERPSAAYGKSAGAMGMLEQQGQTQDEYGALRQQDDSLARPEAGVGGKIQRGPGPMQMTHEPVMGALGQSVAPDITPAEPQRGALASPEVNTENSFEEMFKKLPEKQQVEAVDNFEKDQGIDIEKSYEALMDNMDEPIDTSLNRKEKGMLLMEFGLQMMALSSANTGSQGDTGGALGLAGMNAFQSYQQMRQSKYDNAMRKREGKLGALEKMQEQRRLDRKADAESTQIVEDETGQHAVDKSGVKPNRRVAGTKPRATGADDKSKTRDQRIANLSGVYAESIGEEAGKRYAISVVDGDAPDLNTAFAQSERSIRASMKDNGTYARELRGKAKESGVSLNEMIRLEAREAILKTLGSDKASQNTSTTPTEDLDPLGIL